MRNYSKVDMIRFVKFAKENADLKPVELLNAYDVKYPELSSKEKLINLTKALRIEGLHKALTGESLPPEDEYFEQTRNCAYAVLVAGLQERRNYKQLKYIKHGI